MALQGVALSLPRNNAITASPYDRQTRTNNNQSGLPSRSGTASAALSIESYKSNKFAMDITTSDGDRVSLSFESVEYSKSVLSVRGDASDPTTQDMINFVKDQYMMMKKSVIDAFAKSLGMDVGESEGTQESTKIEMPEYWNPENTSQRIVDFATSFLGAFSGAGEDFLKMIKGAIEDGFKQARDMLGDISSEVGDIIDQTHKLVMEKLDNWASEKGISTQENLTNS